jgi:lipopolysaccharide/colanic/teichoic acid biosynthesis glycosyltransferase
VRDYSGQAVVIQDTLDSQPTDINEFSNRWVNSVVRRCFDSLVAAISLLLVLPIMLLIMLLVRVSSSGPVLFQQRRAGRHRNEFTLYKFRSMRVEDTPGSPITVSGDPRITALGAFLRRYKLDELPQFWNVLIGDMSLVGPRPKLPHHEGLTLPCRPGITGLASLTFRNEEKLLAGVPLHKLDAFYDIYIKPRKAQLDSEYVQSATFWSDLRILWLTAASCFCDLDSPGSVFQLLDPAGERAASLQVIEES